MIYGWDCSTSVVGVACFEDDGPSPRLVRSYHYDLRKVEGLSEKALFVQERAWQDIVPGSTCFIEERLGGFSGGRTSAQVLMKLGAFNALVQFVLFTHGCQVRTIHPSTWKAAVRRMGLFTPKDISSDQKKQLVLDWVAGREPGFEVELNRNGKPQPWMFDRADSYCVGLAGWKLLQEERADAEGAKARGIAEVPEERGPGDRG